MPDGTPDVYLALEPALLDDPEADDPVLDDPVPDDAEPDDPEADDAVPDDPEPEDPVPDDPVPDDPEADDPVPDDVVSLDVVPELEEPADEVLDGASTVTVSAGLAVSRLLPVVAGATGAALSDAVAAGALEDCDAADVTAAGVPAEELVVREVSVSTEAEGDVEAVVGTEDACGDVFADAAVVDVALAVVVFAVADRVFAALAAGLVDPNALASAAARLASICWICARTASAICWRAAASAAAGSTVGVVGVVGVPGVPCEYLAIRSATTCAAGLGVQSVWNRPKFSSVSLLPVLVSRVSYR